MRSFAQVLLVSFLCVAYPELLTGQDSLPRRLAGCWHISMTPWRPVMEIGEDTVFETPPEKIELLPQRGTSGFEQRGWIVRPAPNTLPSVHRFSFYTLTQTDSIGFVWTTGFSGFTMQVAVGRDTLLGQAHSFWDFGRPPQTADVILTRIPCE